MKFGESDWCFWFCCCKTNSKKYYDYSFRYRRRKQEGQRKEYHFSKTKKELTQCHQHQVIWFSLGKRLQFYYLKWGWFKGREYRWNGDVIIAFSWSTHFRVKICNCLHCDYNCEDHSSISYLLFLQVFLSDGKSNLRLFASLLFGLNDLVHFSVIL